MKASRFEVVAGLIKKYDCKFVAEVGVHEALILQTILKEIESTITIYYLIDFWRRHPPHGPQSEKQWDEWARQVYKKYWDYPKAQIIRLTSLQATTLFKPNSLDMVYIDACHKEHCVQEDINAWLPIVKKGKVLAGHDWHLRRVRDPVYKTFGEKKVHIIEASRREVASWYIVKE